MKRISAVLLLLLIMLLPLFGLAEEAPELIGNGGFEETDAAGNPLGWEKVAYRTQTGCSTLEVTEKEAHSGSRSVLIDNMAGNDARFVFRAQVEPLSMYRFSAWVLVDSLIEEGRGANLAVEDAVSTSEGLFEPGEGWTLLEWYGMTGEGQKEVSLGVRVGGYGMESKGRAYFDDASLAKIDVLPEGQVASPWFAEEEPVSAASTGQELSSSSRLIANLIWIGIGGVAFLLLFVLNRKAMGFEDRKRCFVFALFFAALLVVRVVLALLCEGYQVDINCFRSWSLRIAQKGPGSFYEEGYFCDYPPGAVLLLYPVGLLLGCVGGDNALSLLCIKLLPIVADLLGALLLYRWGYRKHRPEAGFLAGGLYLIAPMVTVTGAAWGQMDSVMALLLLLAVWFAAEKKWHIAFPIYVFSVLVKTQSLLAGPVALAWFLICFLRNREERKLLLRQLAVGIVISLGVAGAVVLPFCMGKNPLAFLFSLYEEIVGSYDYAVLNTANFSYLMGGNWVAMSQNAPMAAFLLLGAGVAVGCAVLLLRQRSTKKGRAFALLLAALCVFCVLGAVFGASWSLLGYGMLAFSYLFVILRSIFDGELSHLPFDIALVLTLLYVFGPKIHERYLFAALPLYLLAYILTEDRRLIPLCVGFSLTVYINTAVILSNSVVLGSSYGHLNQDTFALNVLLCLANIGLALYSCYIAIDGLREHPLEALREESRSRALRLACLARQGEDRPILSAKLGIRPVDYAIMLGVSALYAVVCFTNLGSTVAPQTAYVSSSPDETVVLQLQEESEFSLLYYAGVSYYDFSVSVSDDGENWSTPTPCQLREGLCYRWLYALSSTLGEDGTVTYASDGADQVLWFTGRYIRVHACSAGLNLWEIVARDRNGNNLPLSCVSHDGLGSETVAAQYPADHLCDEANTCVGEPGWYNGTYFDEIYYARTAYELLHGQTVYETSHPPLGKLLMSIGVALFGMTPFGWRFAGALIGVLMLPVMYLLAYQLIRKRSAAIAAMGAMALGLMHFTQTRIATIDSFPVFFIMLSYWFMIRYIQGDFFALETPEDPHASDGCFLHGLLPLLGCGISMGLSIASKWIGMYSALGLAVILFTYLIRRLRMASALRQAEYGGSLRAEGAAKVARKRVLLTCGFCLVFFIAIPAAIYYLCYIPYFVSGGGITLKKLVDAQVSMFRYHSQQGLGMDHPFYSPWWQWPLLMKPMWYEKDYYEPTGYDSTISCFGNQWVIYLGVLAMIGVIVWLVVKAVRKKSGESLYKECAQPFIILIGFTVQYLPWVLVPRGTYMYHYFAAIPFLILATVWFLSLLPYRLRPVAAGCYLLGALVFFGLYFPHASGLLVSTETLASLKQLYAGMKAIPGFEPYFNLWY